LVSKPDQEGQEEEGFRRCEKKIFGLKRVTGTFEKEVAIRVGEYAGQKEKWSIFSEERGGNGKGPEGRKIEENNTSNQPGKVAPPLRG